jgi:hypothetical protein
MSVNRALQGLLGGLSSGLGGFQDQRQQQMENDQKVRQLQVQEAEAKRMAQVSEFERLKAAYEAANPSMDMDPQIAQGFAGKFPLIKSETGGMRRPFSVTEQAQDAQAKLTQLGITDKTMEREGFEFISQNPNMPHDQLSRLVARYGIGANQVPPTLQDIQSEAKAKFAPQIELAGINNAADLQQTGMQTAATKYSADQMYRRVTDAAGMKPVDPKKYSDWKMQYFATNPQAREMYNTATRDHGPAQAEVWLTEAYRQMFGPQE